MASQMLQTPNHPPPTQGRIFINVAEQPLKIFVEPSEVPNRTRLIRTLKTSGASTCKDVAEADIIVVTPETASSQELIDGWNEKIFLDANWVYESIRRGRAYLEDENWGGFNVNTPTSASAGGTNVTVHNPLPTPRETPSESQPQQEGIAMQQQQAPLPEPLQFVHAGSPVPMSQFPQQHSIPQQLPGGQVVPMQGITPNQPVMVPAGVLAQLMGIAQQQGMASMSQIPPVNVLPPGQPIPFGFMQQAMPFMPQPAMFPQGGFTVAQHVQQFPSQITNIPVPQSMGIGLPVPGRSHHDSSSPDMQRGGSISTSYRGSPMDQDERDLAPISSGSKSREGDKRKRRREDDHEPSGEMSLFMKRPGEPYLFFVQVEIRNRARIADPIKKHGGKLVPDINQADYVILGHPATKNFEEWLRQSDFYHKLPLKPQWVFDCLEEHELVDVEEYVYEGFRVEKKRGRRSKTGQRYILTAVKSGSEDESENEEGGSEDEDEAEERVKHGGVKKKRKVEEKPAKHVKVKPEQQKVSVEKKQKKQKTAVKEEKMMKKASKAVHDEATIKTNSKGKAGIKGKGKEPVKTSSKAPDSVPQRGPPSPPPPTIVVEHSTGRHVYTKEDYDYCDEYIPILLARDPTMSNSTIAEKLHVKMPHHSAASWMTVLSATTWREKLARQRRRAEIQNRKLHAQANGEPSTGQEPHVTTLSLGKQQPAASASTVNHTGTSDSVPANPTRTMAEFFANGRADSLEDAAVWRVMAQEHPEFDAHGWENYWSQNSDAIAAEVVRLTGLPAHGVNNGGPKAEPE